MTTTTTARWSTVTEAALQAEYDAAKDAIPGHRWPDGWQDWQTERIIRDLRAIRITQEESEA